MLGIKEVLISIGKAHLIVLTIIFLSYIIESFTALKLFIDNYRWKKSSRNADAISNRDLGIYLIILVIVFIYDIVNDNLEVTFISFVVWLLITSGMVKVFFRIHRKYQAVDPNKSDDDYL
jgi:hypothetical protein